MSDPSDSRSLYYGSLIDLRGETAHLPNGVTQELEVIRHPGAAAALVHDGRGRVCLLHQYRHPADGWVWEVPAGKMDPGETPEDSARRELEEEAGVLAEQWQPLGAVLTAPAFTDERIHLFLARASAGAPTQHAPGEVLTVHWLAAEEALRMAREDEIQDGKTLAALLRGLPLLDGWPPPP